MTARPPTPPRPNGKTSKNDEIPVLTTVTPAMYVPITQDLFAPYEAPTSPASRIEASLSIMDAHTAAVKANIMALTRRECIRIAREARWNQNMHLPPEQRMALHPEDRKAMVANLEAPKEAAAGKQLPSGPDFDAWPVNGPDEVREKKLLAIVSRTMSELSGYERHVAPARKEYVAALERERQKEAEGDAMDIDAVGQEGESR